MFKNEKKNYKKNKSIIYNINNKNSNFEEQIEKIY